MNRLLCTALVVLAPTVAQADARDLLDEFAQGLETLSADFEQITVAPGGEVVEESTGQVYFHEPDRFRWDYETPFRQELVADGETIWNYDHALEQVTRREQPEAGQSPMMVLMRPELLERFYRIEPTDEARVIEFLPRAEQADFERARLHFRDGRPDILEIEDAFDQLTRVILTNLERNPELPGGLFDFEPPEGVDVLEGY